MLLPFLLAATVQAAGTPDKVVAVLDGKTVTTEAELAAWRAAQSCYGPDAIASRKAGFMRLLEAAIAEQALRTQGGPAPAPGDLENEAERIDRETRAPEILGCIKRAFGAGRKQYLTIFVRPVLIETRLREFLPKDRKVQAGPHKAVAQALAAMAKGESFETAAKAAGMDVSTWTYSLTAPATAQIEPAPGAMPWSPYEANFIQEHLRPLAPLGTKKEPIESDYDIRLVKLLEAEGGRYTFASASARKATQEDWFKSLPKMKLRIQDAELKSWVQSIKGNPRLSAVSLVGN